MTDHPDRSRRDLVASAVTIAAIASAAGDAQAQTTSNLRFSNPPGMAKPPSYSHVVEVNGPHRTVYLAGQMTQFVDATPTQCADAVYSPFKELDAAYPT